MRVWLNAVLSFGRLKADSFETNIKLQSMCFVKCMSILWSVKGGFIRDQHQVWMITLSAYKYVAYISGMLSFRYTKFLKQWSSCGVSINKCAQPRVKRRFWWKKSIFKVCKPGKMAKWIKCNGSGFLSATNLKVVLTFFQTVCSFFPRRTDTKVFVSKLTTWCSIGTWFPTETTCKERELKSREIYISTF